MNRAGGDAQRSARVALLLCAASVAGLTLARAAVSAFSIGGLAAILAQALMLVLFVLTPSVLGLLVLDGDRTHTVRFASLNTAQIACYGAAGALAVFPAALLGGLLEVIAQSFAGAVSQAVAATQLSASLFLPMLLCHALLAPVGEELFFRGYLLGSFEACVGRRRAVAATSLLFALAHGFGSMTPVHLLLGLLFALLALRANSVLAPMLAHACYNAALVSLQFLGAGALLNVRSLPACALMLLGSAMFAAAFWRALALRGSVHRARVWDGRGLSRRELTLLAGAALALVASLIVGGLLR